MTGMGRPAVSDSLKLLSSSEAEDRQSSEDPSEKKVAPESPVKRRQPCPFFLKTGNCAFGSECKFDHPLDQPATQYNTLGLPLRPGEPDCAYYVKNLHCGYGASCKFHHAEPVVSWMSIPNVDASGVPVATMQGPMRYSMASTMMAPTASSPPGQMHADPRHPLPMAPPYPTYDMQMAQRMSQMHLGGAMRPMELQNPQQYGHVRPQAYHMPMQRPVMYMPTQQGMMNPMMPMAMPSNSFSQSSEERGMWARAAPVASPQQEAISRGRSERRALQNTASSPVSQFPGPRLLPKQPTDWESK